MSLFVRYLQVPPEMAKVLDVADAHDRLGQLLDEFCVAELASMQRKPENEEQLGEQLG